MTDIDQPTGLRSWAGARPFPIGAETLPGLLDEVVRTAPDRLALVDGERSWTYGELHAVVLTVAGSLASKGVSRGDRVAWILPNVAELPIGFFATQSLGAVFVGINPSLAPAEQQALVEHSGAILRVDEVSVEALIARGEAAPPPPLVHHDPHAPAAIAYTSGTTGRPKGAVHSQHNILWQAAASLWRSPPRTIERHGTPLAVSILNIMALGPVNAFARLGTCVMLRGTRATEHASDIEHQHITHDIVVPTVASDLIDDPTIGRQALSTLSEVLVGGAGVSAQLRRDFDDRFGVRMIASYGLTEAIAGVAREPLDEPIDEATVGRAQAPVRLVVVDDDDEPVPAGVIGEVCVAAVDDGPWRDSWTPMLGYWNDKEATEKALRGDVLHTGDLGHLDESGRLTLTGRMSDVIIRGGANVYPSDVEAVLLTDPNVKAAAVLGLPDDRLGERVVAVVEVSAATTPDRLIEHCGHHLARYKTPDRVLIVDSLPRNAMGKVVKAELAPLFDD